MRMDTRIPMLAQTPDPINALAFGQAAGQRQTEFQNQNALRGYMRENGAGIMSGDQNALAGLAGFDPGMAVDIQGAQLGQQATRQGMRHADERLKLAYQEAAQSSARLAAGMSAQEAAMKAAEGERVGALIQTALQGGPEAWDRLNDQIPGMENVPFEDAPMVYARVTGAAFPFKEKAETWRPASPEEAAQYGSAGGQFGPDGKFDPINPPSGMIIEADGQGGFRLAQGSGVTGKPLTEGQGKDNMYSTMMRGALPDLEQYETSLTNFGDSALDLAPGGVGRFGQTEEYKIAKNAAQEFTTAVLRKQSGAAITADEQRIADELYIPGPTDGPGVLARKRQARARALAAVESGMSPEQIIMQERALTKSGGTEPTRVDGSPPDWLTSTDVTTWTPEQMEQAEEYWGLK